MLRDRYLWPAFALATLLFYFAPLFLPNASIHWDLADVSYPAQKYFEQALKSGHLPHWTPFLNSGTPFLADPQSGAWYPLHWPFFLVGITPRALMWEVALHSFLALSGMFLLARRLFGRTEAALAGAMFYVWSGYFAGRSSQLSKFEAAALLPWLLWATLSAIETGSIRFVGLAGLAGGLIVLTGDFPSAIFCFFALALFVAALQKGWKPAAIVVLLAILVGAIVLIPGASLLQDSTPYPTPDSALQIKGLAAIFSADYWGVITGLYKGPEDMRQFYIYGGLLLAPMVLTGLVRREKLWLLGALIVPPLSFALGPSAGLYRVLSRIPGLRDAASPMDFWFVAALGLGLAASSGAVLLTEQTKKPYLWILLVVLTAADLWHWNLYRNPLVYAHASFEEIYGKPQQRFEKNLDLVKRPFFRLWSSTQTSGLGPLDGSLLSRTEVSYGSGFQTLDRYASYLSVIRRNPQLLNDLAITNGIDTQRGTIVENPAPLGRVTAPPTVDFVQNRAAAHQKLEQLDPSKSAIAEVPARDLSPAGAQVNITRYEGDLYEIQTDAPGAFLLKLAVPYHAGWKASIDQNPTDVFPVNEALTGAFIPAGRHQVVVRFQPLNFLTSVSISLLGLVICAALMLFSSSFSRLIR
jgi:Bacterial membrane protein YfhO